jgi:outer membrane receptor for ferrienterochelin and colicin
MDESYELCGPTNLTADLLNAHQTTLGLEITSSSFGDYVSGLRGYNFETLGLSMYWAIYLNDEFAMVGISELLIADGDVLLFEASSY